MRKVHALRWLLTAGALILSSIATAQVRISEIHYDNTGADVGEAIEVSAPAGMDLTGWSVVLYNGNGGASYNAQPLTGVVPATCDARGVVVIDYPANGIQNGSPDGVALVNSGGTVIEFLSYEGVFAATDGPALGVTSVDIGVSENGTEPAGQSLARNADSTWNAPAASSFGTCNDNGAVPPPPPAVASITIAPPSGSITVGNSLAFAAQAFDAGSLPIAGVAFTWASSNTAVATVSPAGVATGVAAGDVTIVATAANGVAGSAALHVDAAPPPPPLSDIRVTEIHYDNAGVDTGEAIEIEGPDGTTLTGYSLVLYDGTGGAVYNTQTLSGTVTSCGNTRGVLVVNYPANGIQNGSPDGIALLDPLGQLLEFISYEGTFTPTIGPAAGLQSVNIGEEPATTPIGSSFQRNPVNDVWAVGASTFGACNSDGGTTPPGNTISFSGRVPSDPPLPVGYEDQIFATLHSGTGATLPSTFIWAPETPAIATIDANGVFRALTEGTAVFRATAADGTTATYALPTRVAVASGVTYPGNAEFGEPADSDPSDDFIVRHEQYTASYNPNRGSPNWVSYDLDAAHFGPEDRCDCFTMDPDLPASFPQISTNDYTGAGAFAGYGIDRGHMTRSFDRTSGSLDNARTFLFSNVVPQAADLNQGPWANMENDLGNLARFENREVYVITGVAGNIGTLKNEGRVVIPASTWKVAVIMPHDTGLADIHDYRDLEVIAVDMPNVPGVRNVDWNTYRVTVDVIEAASGYDLLALLPDDVENAVESGTEPPIGAISGPGSSAEGSSATFSAGGSIDPNGIITSYDWDFGDGTTGSGIVVTHTFAQDGTYVVRLTLTDNDGLVTTIYTTQTVTNVVPVVGAIPDGNVNVGTVYTVSGTFTDPGADSWTATVNWGDGTAPSVVALSTRSFSTTHTYATANLYTVTVTINDDDASGSASHSVTVAQPAPALSDALVLVDRLVASGKLKRALGTALKAEISTAQRLLERGDTQGAIVVLRATVVSIDLLVRLRQVNAADIAPLRSLLVQTINRL